MVMSVSNRYQGVARGAPFHWRQFWLPAIFASGLVFLSYYNYLAFHVAVESFTVGVAITMFVIIWHTYYFSHNHFLMFLSVGYFWIGWLDAIHTLLYYGMPTALDQGNYTSQFWIVARFIEALFLLVAPLFIERPINRTKVMVVIGSGSALIASIVFAGYFPDTFVDGLGLTRFKVGAEYVIVALLLAAMAHLRHHRDAIDPSIYQLMIASISLTIGAELAFTFYVSMYGLSNLVGHLFKLFSFWLIYVAIIRTSLIEPFRILSHDLQEVHALHQEAQQLASLGHWSFDLASNKLYWSDEIYRIFDIDPEEISVSYEAFIGAIHPDDRKYVHDAYQESLRTRKPYNIVHRLLLKDGSIKYVNEQCRTHYDEEGQPLRSTGTIQDITATKLAEMEIQKMAITDHLTQLPNRAHFHHSLEKALYRSKRHSFLIGLAILDLDGFKPINDTYGHQVGDLVLREVSNRLKGVFREVDTVARLGGDEFAIILEAPESPESASKPLQRAVELLQQPIQVDGVEVNIGASVGIAFFPADSAKPEELMRMADQALYAAKKEGRGRVKIHCQPSN